MVYFLRVSISDNCRGSLHRVISDSNNHLLKEYGINFDHEKRARSDLAMWYTDLGLNCHRIQYNTLGMGICRYCIG